VKTTTPSSTMWNDCRNVYPMFLPRSPEADRERRSVSLLWCALLSTGYLI
jgi:hypothetical protein